MSVSGFGSSSGIDAAGAADDADGAGAPDGAAATETPREASIVRGTEPRLAPMLADMSATQLQRALESGGATEAEATEQAAEITATADEIQGLEAELESLYEIESLYEEMLADPETDPWDTVWLEWDLWDVRMDIYDIEDQLGKLEGDLDGLLSEAWDRLSGAMVVGDAILRGDTDFAQESARQRIDVGRQETERARGRSQELDTGYRDRVADLQRRGLMPPVPPQSEVAREKLEAVRTLLDKTRGHETREIFRELSDAMREIRGATGKAGD